MEFIDGDGNIVVPRAVRPIMDINQTVLGSKKGAKRQYRQGNLHIRDYDTHYTVHMDRFDPRSSPLNHLLIDAPEYLVGSTAAALVGRHVCKTVYRKRKEGGKASRDAAIDAIIAGGLAASAAGKFFFAATSAAKKKVS